VDVLNLLFFNRNAEFCLANSANFTGLIKKLENATTLKMIARTGKMTSHQPLPELTIIWILDTKPTKSKGLVNQDYVQIVSIFGAKSKTLSSRI